ncbi:MAG TPA: outer membrane beta-barrel domain-containing protein [Bdellovibrionales bacterium]|nr:outer membrane beta-barrel domain-containing protein [Bdellovibrionales bacterium]
MKLSSLILCALLLPQFTFAADEDEFGDAYDIPQVVALEKRLYSVNYELTPQMGFYPLDSFNKSLVFGLSLTNFSDSYRGWEIFNVQYAMNIETDLKDQLISNFNVRPTGILDYIEWTAFTSYVYTPFYSKNLAFNSKVVHGDLSLVGGPGLVSFHSGDRAFAGGGGFIMRFFLNQRYSAKFDARTYYHMGENKNTNFLLMLNLGLSIQMGGTDKK